MNMILNKYVISDITNLIQKYYGYSLENILNIMNKNYSNFVIMNVLKSHLYLKDIIIYFTDNNNLIAIHYLGDFENLIREYKIKITNENKHECNFILNSKINHNDFLLVLKKIKSYEINDDFTNVILELLKKYSIKSYNIFFIFGYYRAYYHPHSLNYITTETREYPPHNIIDIFPSQIKENITSSYSKELYITINIKN
jgi:hypothetical protein